MPTRVALMMTPASLPPDLHRSIAPHINDQPVKKQSKWSAEEDAAIIELRGGGMKWEDISKRLPGRSAISCRLHYQNYLERRSEWDEERKNKLARLYERFKSEMWAKVAEELAIPWRAAEAMHWQLGEAEMARRAGVVPFSLAAVNLEGNRKSPARSYASPQPQGIKARERAGRSPRPKTGQTPPAQPVPGHSGAPPPPAPIITLQQPPPPPPQQASLPPPQTLRLPPNQMPQQAPPSNLRPGPEPHDLYRSPGPGLAPLQMQPSVQISGLLPSVAELTTGVSPYTTPGGAPSPGPWLTKANPGNYFTNPPGHIGLEPNRPKRRASQDVNLRETSYRRRL